jgi:hypothetical protein
MFESGEYLEVIGMAALGYLFLSLTIARLGSQRKCGAVKGFLVSFFLTPIPGVLYVMKSPRKSVMKIVHYRCKHCGLEYTSAHRYCHHCAKEGHKYHLHRISMRTY